MPQPMVARTGGLGEWLEELCEWIGVCEVWNVT